MGPLDRPFVALYKRKKLDDYDQSIVQRLVDLTSEDVTIISPNCRHSSQLNFLHSFSSILGYEEDHTQIKPRYDSSNLDAYTTIPVNMIIGVHSPSISQNGSE